MEKEKRVIAGKARSCKIVGKEITEVYDEDKKVYVPFQEFLRQQEEYKTNPIVDDTEDAKKEYYTTHGKKTKVVKDDNKKTVMEIPTNILSTTSTNFSTSGTANINFPDVPIIDIKLGSDKKKEEEKEYGSIIDEYMDILVNE